MSGETRAVLYAWIDYPAQVVCEVLLPSGEELTFRFDKRPGECAVQLVDRLAPELSADIDGYLDAVAS